MEDFFYKNRVIKLISVTGEVVADRKLLETVVTLVGGSETVAPDIESYAVPRHEFWIKSTDGVEYDFQLRDVDIPLRDGQKITVISAVSVGTGKVNPAVMVNHTAGKHWYIDKAPALLLKLNLPFISAGAQGALVTLFVVGGILKSGAMVLVSLAMLLVVSMVKAGPMDRAEKALEAHLERVAEELLGRESKKISPMQNEWIGQ